MMPLLENIQDAKLSEVGFCWLEKTLETMEFGGY